MYLYSMKYCICQSIPYYSGAVGFYLKVLSQFYLSYIQNQIQHQYYLAHKMDCLCLQNFHIYIRFYVLTRIMKFRCRSPFMNVIFYTGI